MLRTAHPFRPASEAALPMAAACLTLAGMLFLSNGVYALSLPTLPHALLSVHHGEKHEHEKQIEALEMQWRQAQMNNDVPLISRLLADDYIGITANGMVQTREEALAMYKTRALVFHRLDLTEVKVRVHGNTAVVTSRAEVEATHGGTNISGLYRYMRVYVRKQGCWKIVNFEVTRIYDPSARFALRGKQ